MGATVWISYYETVGNCFLSVGVSSYLIHIFKDASFKRQETELSTCMDDRSDN